MVSAKAIAKPVSIESLEPDNETKEPESTLNETQLSSLEVDTKTEVPKIPKPTESFDEFDVEDSKNEDLAELNSHIEVSYEDGDIEPTLSKDVDWFEVFKPNRNQMLRHHWSMFSEPAVRYEPIRFEPEETVGFAVAYYWKYKIKVCVNNKQTTNDKSKSLCLDLLMRKIWPECHTLLKCNRDAKMVMGKDFWIYENEKRYDAWKDYLLKTLKRTQDSKSGNSKTTFKSGFEKPVDINPYSEQAYDLMYENKGGIQALCQNLHNIYPNKKGNRKCEVVVKVDDTVLDLDKEKYARISETLRVSRAFIQEIVRQHLPNLNEDELNKKEIEISLTLTAYQDDVPTPYSVSKQKSFKTTPQTVVNTFIQTKELLAKTLLDQLYKDKIVKTVTAQVHSSKIPRKRKHDDKEKKTKKTRKTGPGNDGNGKTVVKKNGWLNSMVNKKDLKIRPNNRNKTVTKNDSNTNNDSVKNIDSNIKNIKNVSNNRNNRGTNKPSVYRNDQPQMIQLQQMNGMQNMTPMQQQMMQQQMMQQQMMMQQMMQNQMMQNQQVTQNYQQNPSGNRSGMNTNQKRPFSSKPAKRGRR